MSDGVAAPPDDAAPPRPPADPGAAADVFPGASEMAARCRALDWAATPLGPVAGWPAALRVLVRTCLESPFPVNLWCGPALVLVYNDAYRRTLGTKHPAALGRSGLDVWTEIRGDLEPMFAQIRAGGPTLFAEDERFVVTRRGARPGDPAGGTEDAYFTYGLSPVRDEDGAVVALFNPATETTGRVRAEAERAAVNRALEVERARLAEVFRQSPTFLAVLRGPGHVFETVNEAYTRLVGGRDVLGHPALEALPEVRAQGFGALLDRVLTTGEPFVGRETPIRLAAGGGTEERFLDFQYLPLVEADATGARRVAGVIAHGVDVTDQVRARREVERLLGESERARAEADVARAEAERANQAKSEFLAAMSHELRTPLNAIGGYAQLMELGVAGPVTPEQRNYLARLATSGQHLLGLVNDVLDLAKVDAGALTIVRRRATTEAAVAAAFDLVRPQAAARGVALVDGNPAESVPYVGDEHRVRQILVNLLSNAVKFTGAGGTVTVTCGLADEAPPAARLHGAGPWARVRVEDTGVGIAPEEQAAVFEPFHQVEQGHTRSAGGTGLGLAISRRLARLMGGDLTLESTPGVGSTFTLWLPAAREGAAGGGEGVHEAADARVTRAARAAPELVRGLGDLGARLRRQLDAVVEGYAARLRTAPDAPRARAMGRAELEDHLVTALADLAQTLVIVGEAGTAETGLLADSVAINKAVAERHGTRRFAQGWDLPAVRADYAVLREVLARTVRADARAEGADAEAALSILLGFVEQSEARALDAWRAAHALDAEDTGGVGVPAR